MLEIQSHENIFAKGCTLIGQENFLKLYRTFGENINYVKVDLSNYATKANLKNGTGFVTSKLSAKSELASLKAKIDKLKAAKSDKSDLEKKTNDRDKKIPDASGLVQKQIIMLKVVK